MTALEVPEELEHGRRRALVQMPHTGLKGWITLVDITTGFRFAKKAVSADADSWPFLDDDGAQ